MVSSTAKDFFLKIKVISERNSIEKWSNTGID